MAEYITINKKFVEDLSKAISSRFEVLGDGDVAEADAEKEIQKQYTILANVCLRAANPEKDMVEEKNPPDYLNMKHVHLGSPDHGTLAIMNGSWEIS